MTRKLCVKCGGLVLMKNGQEPPLTMFGYVQCWACYDGVSERIGRDKMLSTFILYACRPLR